MIRLPQYHPPMNGPCISCGMPQAEAERHGVAHPDRDYCGYCSQEDGSMKSYAEVFAGFTRFWMQDQGVSEDEAQMQVRAMMRALPAWRDVPEAQG